MALAESIAKPIKNRWEKFSQFIKLEELVGAGGEKSGILGVFIIVLALIAAIWVFAQLYEDVTGVEIDELPEEEEEVAKTEEL